MKFGYSQLSMGQVVSPFGTKLYITYSRKYEVYNNPYTKLDRR